MPLRAMAFTGQKYLSYELRDDLKRVPWFCPHCFGKMVFVDADLKIKHFRHFVECPYETEPESQTHLEIKQFIYEAYRDCGAELEKRLGNKITDVFVPNLNNGTCFEVQLSPISEEEMCEREENASSFKYGLFWVFSEWDIEKIARDWGYYPVVYRLKRKHQHVLENGGTIYEYIHSKKEIVGNVYQKFASRETTYYLKKTRKMI
jgi:competence CoiA-like predicted nuclease